MGILERITALFKQYEPSQEEIQIFEAQKKENNITKDTTNYKFSNLVICQSIPLEKKIIEMYQAIPFRYEISISLNRMIYEVEFLGGVVLSKRIVIKSNENIINAIENILAEHNFLGFKKDKILDDLTCSPSFHSDVKSVTLCKNEQQIGFSTSDYHYQQFDVMYEKLQNVLDAKKYFDKMLLEFLK